MADTTFVAQVTKVLSTWLQDVNDAVYRQKSGLTGAVARALGAKLGDVVSVKDFGAVANGVTNDYPAVALMLTALVARGGGVGFFPAGSYRIDSQISLPSNVTLLGEGPGKTIFITNSTSSSSPIVSTGSSGTQFAISAPITYQGTAVSTTLSHGMVALDYLRVVGQRNCISNDAVEDWRLGYGTPSALDCYYAEFGRVLSSGTVTTITLCDPVMFPNYLQNSASETPAYNPRAATTVEKVTFVVNAGLDGIEIRQQQDVSGGLIRFTLARECFVRNCRITHGAFVGPAVYFDQCLDCVGEDTISEYKSGVPSTVSGNAFKVVSSQRSGYRRCTSYYAFQGFDATYSQGTYCCVEPFFEQCAAVGSNTTGITTHGGVYAAKIVGNRLSAVRQGILCRARSSTIVGNVGIGIGNTATTAYGVALAEGWARDCTISGNTMTGFRSGYGVIDGAGVEESFQRIDSIFSDNIARLCTFAGFEQNGSGANTSVQFQGLKVVNNKFIACGQGVFIDGPCAGVRVDGNEIVRCTGATYAIQLGPDCQPWSSVSDNVFHDIGAGNTGIRVDANSLAFAGTINFTTRVNGNRFFGTFAAKSSVSATFVEWDSYATDAGSRDGELVITDGVTAPAVLAGFAQIYADTADGDLKVIFGDGTVKTIVVDT